MNLFEFLLAVITVRYLYKIMTSRTLDKSNLITVISDTLKPYLIKEHNEYVKLHDEFLSKVIEANGDVVKIVQASDDIIKKFKLKEDSIQSFDVEEYKKLNKIK